MSSLLKVLLIIGVFMSALVYFTPKENLYNFLEQELSKNHLIISNEIKEENFLGLKVKEADIYFDGLNIAFIKEIDLNSFFLFTNIQMNTIKVPNEFENKIVSNIDQISLQHSIFQLFKASIVAQGEFGEFHGEILFFDGKIVGELIPSEVAKLKYKKLLREFKLVDGKYKYEYRF